LRAGRAALEGAAHAPRSARDEGGRLLLQAGRVPPGRRPLSRPAEPVPGARPRRRGALQARGLLHQDESRGRGAEDLPGDPRELLGERGRPVGGRPGARGQLVPRPTAPPRGAPGWPPSEGPVYAICLRGFSFSAIRARMYAVAAAVFAPGGLG